VPRRLLLAVLALLALAGRSALGPVALPAAASPPTNPTTTWCEADRDPLPEGLAAELAARYPARRFSAAVVDDQGCTYLLAPERRMTTASVLKIEVMVGVMLRAQAEGRSLSQWERDRIWPMITESANPPTTELWSSLGGAPGMEGIDGQVGLVDTEHASPRWGLTTTSALDQARFVRAVWTGVGSPLGPAMRAEARQYLTSVVPSQRWGATAGVPAGWTVGQKNGFAAYETLGWRINTAGWIERPDGSGWSVVVLSDGWGTEDEGIAAVHELAGRINRAMVDAPAAGPGVAATAGRIDLFDGQPGGAVLQRFGPPGGPYGTTPAGGLVSSDLDGISAPTADRPPEAIARGADGQPWRWRWDGGAWQHDPLGGRCSSGPTAVYSGSERFDAYCRGLDGQLWAITWRADAGWSGWTRVGGQLTSDPDAATAGAGASPSVFVRGTDDAVWQFVPTGSGWYLQSLGGRCTSGPAAVHSGPARADLFCRGVDGQLWWRSWTPPGWGPWQPLGGLLASDPDAASAGPDASLVVAVAGVDGRTWTYRLVGGGWSLAAAA
jgi:hypothetical protein